MIFMNNINVIENKGISCLKFLGATAVILTGFSAIVAIILGVPFVTAAFIKYQYDQYMIRSYSDKHDCSTEEATKAYSDYLVKKNEEANKNMAEYVKSPQYITDSNALLEDQEYAWLPGNQFNYLYEDQ
jgi:hypothetical protein